MSETFYVYNLGCKVNRVESDTITACLLERGGRLVSDKEASVIVVNTCTVTIEADAKSRKAVRRFAAAEQHPWVLVTGCSAVLHTKELSALGSRVIVECDRAAALEKAASLLCGEQRGAAQENECERLYKSESARQTRGQATRLGENFKTRVGIKIQDGCDSCCSYCIVPTVRGSAHCVAADEVLAEIERYAYAGTREFVYTGINLGAYRDDSYNLPALLQASLKRAPGARIRLSSLEPCDVTGELLKCIADSKGRICAHLHVPLQSGSDRILKLMNRPYTGGQYEAIIQDIRTVLPHVAITTDVIIGFPSETEKDFAETLALCAKAAFSKIHIFRYSKRPGTPAAAMPWQIPPFDKTQRSRRLSQLGEFLAEKDAASRVGTVENVLVERVGRGTSESYHKVEMTAVHPPGALIPVRFTAHQATVLFG